MFRGIREPGQAWLDTDTVLAAALTHFEATLCPGCGQSLEESMDPSTDASNPAADHRWHVPPPSRCFSCTAIEKATKRYEDAQQPRALRFRAEKVARRVAGRSRSGPFRRST